MKNVNFGYQGLAVAISSSSTDDGCQLRFWRMDIFCNAKYLDHLPMPKEEGCTYRLEMDDHFVVVFQYGQNSRRIIIVLTKTRTVVENLTVSSIGCLHYGNGRIIIEYPDFIR